jgi:Leucine-rich repeat (LRR) protein
MKKILILVGLIVGSLFALVTTEPVWSTGSREGDSLALVAIFEANIGNTLGWDFSKSIEEWDGVYLKNGRVDSLSLISANLSFLPTEIGNLTSLTYLCLYENSLKEIPMEIGNLSNLEELTLSSNKLLTIPAEIGNLKNLTVLSLFRNSLTTMPMEIWNLTKLKMLICSYNSLTTLPKEIGNLINLEDFRISKNSLDSIPNSLWKLLSLTHLDLSYTSLQSVSSEIRNLINLNFLNISGNYLKFGIHPEFFDLLELKQLHLAQCRINSIPKEIGNLVNLTQLHLQINNLSTLPEEITNLKNMQYLSLWDNRLQEENLIADVVTWIDTYEPKWRDNQSEPSPITKINKLTPKQFSVTTSNKTLNFSTPLSPNTQLSIFSINGKEIMRKSISGASINIPSLSQGVYMVRINSESLNSVFKISIK